jgi:small subunit ribosomal protein S27Ae
MTEKKAKEIEEAEEPKEPEVKPEVKPEKKPKEKKIEKAKKKRKGVFSYYKIGEKGLERLLPFCERCGSGYFMADHDDRYTCGHCGFTRYKHSEKSK